MVKETDMKYKSNSLSSLQCYLLWNMMVSEEHEQSPPSQVRGTVSFKPAEEKWACPLADLRKGLKKDPSHSWLSLGRVGRQPLWQRVKYRLGVRVFNNICSVSFAQGNFWEKPNVSCPELGDIWGSRGRPSSSRGSGKDKPGPKEPQIRPHGFLVWSWRL